MLKRISFITIICFLINQNSFAIEEINEFGIIKKSPINVRIGPDMVYKISFTMEKDDINVPFHIRYQLNKWYFIEMTDERNGWINTVFVKKNNNYCVTNKDTFVFFRPAINQKNGIKIGKIKKNIVFKCKNYKNTSLVKTNIKNFRNGWINKSDIVGFK